MANLTGLDWRNKLPISGTYTAVSADDSTGYVNFNIGQAGVSIFLVQVFRSGVNIGNDVKASLTAGVLKVEDGSTYKITDGDVINWLVF